MVMGTAIHEPLVERLKYDEFFIDHQNPVSGFEFEAAEPALGHNNDLIALTDLSTGLPPNGETSSLPTGSLDGDSSEDSENFSDMILNYIDRMLTEEDAEGKLLDVFQGHPSLEATEKPFYDILGEKYPPSPNQPPIDSGSSLGSPDSSIYANSKGGGSVVGSANSSWAYGAVRSPLPESHPVSGDYSSHSSFSSTNSGGEVSEGPAFNPELFAENLPSWQFRKGVEEARRFLPSDDKLVIDLEGIEFSSPRQELRVESELVKVRVDGEREYLMYGSRGRKNPHNDDLDVEEGRSSKQSAVYYSEETLRSEMFDMVLLCSEKCETAICDLREAKQNEAGKNSQNGHSKGSRGGKARGRKQTKNEVVDLRTLLIHCAQAVATDDRRSANELLKQIRQHSSPFGDGTQRLAHCFADGLEARLEGMGSQIHNSLVAKPPTATDILKAYQLLLAACPFLRIAHFFSGFTILKVSESATRVHIIDYGILFGFQWPCFMQRLASRPGGPPKLRITGIEFPQQGFRPAERIEETGRRLAEYARSFDLPFEYRAIAAKWETIEVEDLDIDKDELLIVNCLYRFKNVPDESVVSECPRSRVLNTIRKLNPAIFIQAVINGSYNAPFFVTRFREALFHFSTLFDMLETNVPRENTQRLLIERDIFGREALNVIACEGSDRVERPETYKQWNVRNLRAGFSPLPLNQEIIKIASKRMHAYYHKDYIIDEDNQWLLLGWKGRILNGLSIWIPNNS